MKALEFLYFMFYFYDLFRYFKNKFCVLFRNEEIREKVLFFEIIYFRYEELLCLKDEKLKRLYFFFLVLGFEVREIF